MTPDLSIVTAADLGRGIERGEIDARELCELYLSAISEHLGAASIYSSVTASRARAEADGASGRAKRGLRRGPLDGVPISWKDLFDTAGTKTEAGSRLLAGRIPSVDAKVVANAGRAGLACLGKCHMSELAFSGLGLNPMTATPPNAIDAECAPGGSSSGSAVSVALSLAAASIGSDTGGSVRIPAAWNGIVGLKTSHGVISVDGVVPLCRRIDTVGPLCRSVEDAALLFDALQGKADRQLHAVEPNRLRLLSLNVDFLGSTDPLPTKAYQSDIEKLKLSGISVEEESFGYIQDAFDLSLCLYTAEAYGLWREAIEAAPDSMFGHIRDRFRAGAAFSGPDFVSAWDRMEDLRKRFIHDTAEYDALVLPTMPNTAPKISDLLSDTAFYTAQNLLALRNTRIGNLFDNCAITLPNTSPGCGLMLMAPARQEVRLLQIAKAIEHLITN